MISQENLNQIRKTIREFFEKTTFLVEINFLNEKDGTLLINLKTEEPQILIGEGGETLIEIQHLLKAILRKIIKEPFYLNIDINDYKKKKTEYLKEVARSAADEVALTKKEKTLAPMPAYERRIIHLELANRSDVVSESIGEGPGRSVVVKPRL